MSELNPLDAVDNIYTDPGPSIDFVKMQVAFWEKLVVLDAATLAASFTASGIFRERLIGDGGFGYLSAAWKLLMCGLALCLLAQQIAIPGVIAISGHYYGMRVLSLLNKAEREVQAQTKPVISAIIAQSPRLLIQARVYSRLAGALGSAGLLSSIAALYWLYRFAQINVSNAGH